MNVLASTNIPTEWMSAAVHFFQNIVNVYFIPRYEYARIIVSERQNVSVPSIKLCIKGTVQRDFNLVFLTYIDRARPEYEPLLILKFFRGPHDFRSTKIFFTRLRRNRFRKIILFGKILQIYLRVSKVF